MTANTVEGSEPVEGQGPLGVLNAGAFRFTEGGETLFFTDGVTLVLYPDVRG